MWFFITAKKLGKSMYQLVSAIGKLKSAGARWTTVDITALPLATLYTLYERMVATVTNNFIPGELGLDLMAIRPTYLSSTQTLPEVFQSIGNASLPTTAEIPVLETKYAIYSDAFRSRYKVAAVSPNGHADSDIPMAERPWLALTRPSTDMNLFHRSCLVNVNGLFHLTDTDGTRAYVVDGMKTARFSGQANLGIYSFRELGELEFVPITPAMVHRRYTDAPLNKRLYIDSGVVRENKTAMLVLGGYLHLLDQETFFRVTDSIYAIDFENFPLRDRYFESSKILDLSVLELEHRVGNDQQISEAQLFSDEVLTRYATLSQSFLVFINNTELFMEREGVQRTVMPNTYTSYTEPKYPLVTGVGKISNYWRVFEDQQWSLNVCDAIRDNMLFNTTPASSLVSYDSAREPYNPIELSRAHFLKVGSDIQVN